jgi:hypothetical protein
MTAENDQSQEDHVLSNTIVTKVSPSLLHLTGGTNPSPSDTDKIALASIVRFDCCDHEPAPSTTQTTAKSTSKPRKPCFKYFSWELSKPSQPSQLSQDTEPRGAIEGALEEIRAKFSCVISSCKKPNHTSKTKAVVVAHIHNHHCQDSEEIKKVVQTKWAIYREKLAATLDMLHGIVPLSF